MPSILGAQTRLFTKLRKLKLKTESTLAADKQALSHISWYAAANAGDTVLSDCVRRTFNARLGTTSWNLIHVMEPVDGDMIRRLNRSRAVVIGGGGLFLPDTNANSVSGWQWACSKEQLAQIDVPIIVYSVGYNYFHGQEPEALFIDSLNALAEKSTFFGIRNTGSIRALRAVLKPELKDKPCYQPCTTTVIRYLCPQLPSKKKTGKVAFNFAFDRAERRFGGKQDEILRQAVRSIYAIRDKGYEIYVVAHCPADLTVMQYIKDRAHIHAVNAGWWGMERLTRFYNDIDVVLGMRGHAQMIPFGVNCQIISLGTHEKMKWFLEDIDAGDWYVDLNEDTGNISGRIVNTFERVHEEECDRTDERLHEAQDRLWKITCENMQKIRQSVFGIENVENGGVTLRVILAGGEEPAYSAAYPLPQRGGREYAA